MSGFAIGIFRRAAVMKGRIIANAARYGVYPFPYPFFCTDGTRRCLPVNFPLCQKDKGGCDFNACQSVGRKL
ncbi:hypothetical protein HMPREF0602_1475 [Neisseria meningitidis ATCC 13091]|uniref:Uncharacterized protein n=2 Tax=Neisseria meningitidis TaxID=487 RepID=A0A0H5QD81_NEIMI|nr:hypothetical protein HMPREF0602_1475 [Neisseria meningitidis ATCC 13091]CRY99481.1 hypothetical protein [Neisseria meningitidis serogroup B]